MPLSGIPSNYNLRSVEAAERVVELEETVQEVEEVIPQTFCSMASIRLDQYNGTENIDSYIRRFRDYCAVNKLNSEQQLATLRWHLGGVALVCGTNP
jgi:hypothetical protein